jgi:hypothetical protein
MKKFDGKAIGHWLSQIISRIRYFTGEEIIGPLMYPVFRK